MDTDELVVEYPVLSTFDLGQSPYEADPQIGPSSYREWTIIILRNIGKNPMKIQDLELQWGKLHHDGDKDNAMSPDDYNGRIIEGGDSLRFNTCGRAFSPTGTEGRFSLVDPEDNNKVIRTFHWDCPWGSRSNKFEVNDLNNKWMVEASGANFEGGALGTVTVEVLKK